MKMYRSLTELIGHTPLLALTGYCRENGLNATIAAKLEAFNPAGSVKDRTACAMLDAAEESGALRPGGTIIEPTSGNTGIGLAWIAAARGYRTLIVMPDSMSPERRALIQAYGADLVLTDGALGMKGAIARAQELHEQIAGSLIPDQFSNPANPAVHRRTTGPEIWEDTDGKVDIFVAGVGLAQIHHLILTHAHSDHLLGAVWVVRMVAAAMNAGRYEGELAIWCDPSVREGLCQMARITLQKKMTDRLGDRILFHDISDGQTDTILGRKVTFFDIHSTKMKQMGFTMELAGGGKLCCLGDEPYNPACAAYVRGADWLLCEAFCLYEDRERFKPYEKHHSTVKDACELAQRLGIPHLVLWHTEDRRLAQRQALYTQEGRAYYDGDLHVPNDLDVLALAGE